MTTDPTNISKLTPSSKTYQMEKKSKRSKHFSKFLSILSIIAFIGLVITGICAFGALIPWGIAAIPLVLEVALIFTCLVSLHKINTKHNQKKLYPLPSQLSLKDISSMFSSKDLKKIFFPFNDTFSVDPNTWFSKERLQEAFSKEWSLRFRYKIKTHYENSNCTTALHLLKGDISTFDQYILASSNKIGAIVNAANASMSPGKSGTNAALSQAVTPESWDASKEGKVSLQVSEVSAGQWISQNPVVETILEPTYLFQALGPTPSDCPNIFEAYKALILTYRNCFKKANSLKVTHLQLPLLSNPSFRTQNQDWSIMAKLAFLAGLSLFLEENPNKSNLKLVVLVDLNQLPDFN